MKTEGGQNWYKSNRKEKLSFWQVSFTEPQWTPSQKVHKRVQHLQHILTPSQPVGLVICLSGQISVLIFCVSASVGFKKSQQLTLRYFCYQPTRGSVCFLQANGSKDLTIKNVRNKMKKENLPNQLFTMWQGKRTFWDTPMLHSSDAIMVTADVLKILSSQKIGGYRGVPFDSS